MNYIFSQNYQDFFDIKDPKNIVRAALAEKDFLCNCEQFLVQCFQIHDSTAKAIACALSARMSDARLHYHTLVHVLCMFQTAKQMGIELLLEEHLAIWFHDAIYIPENTDGVNEECSAEFMASLIRPVISSWELECRLTAARVLVSATACHLSETLPPEWGTIMDLDLSHFIFPIEPQRVISECIYKECGGMLTHEDFLHRRYGFLTALMSRGNIFRSSHFDEVQATAMKNLATLRSDVGS